MYDFYKKYFANLNVLGHGSYKNLQYSDSNNFFKKLYSSYLLRMQIRHPKWNVIHSTLFYFFPLPSHSRLSFHRSGGPQHANISLVFPASQKALINDACWIKYLKTKWLMLQCWRVGIESKNPASKKPTLLDIYVWKYSKFFYWRQICWQSLS